MVVALAGAIILLAATMMCLGKVNYNPSEVVRVLMHGPQHEDYFVIGVLRLPRMLAAVFSGLAFGMAGCAFQTLLRNPLASPDMIGINAGASAAAVLGILVFKWSGMVLSTFSVLAGLSTALLIYALSKGQHFSHGKLILIGISIQAAMSALISMLLLRASQYDVQGAMRWLSGSLQTMRLVEIWPLVVAVFVAGSGLVYYKRQLNLLAMGDAMATALGLPAERSRISIIVFAVVLTAFASSLTGPIAFVAFLSGPIANSIVGRGEGHPLAAGLVGAVIVLASDLVGQQLLPMKLPVGVITGLVGSPYLIGLLVKYQRSGGVS